MLKIIALVLRRNDVFIKLFRFLLTFSRVSHIYLNSKGCTFMLYNFLVQTLQYSQKSCCFLAHKNIIALKSSVLHSPVRNFQYYQPAQNQRKSHFLFLRNGSPRDLHMMTLCSPGPYALLIRIS